jgi:hypothetical protein
MGVRADALRAIRVPSRPDDQALHLIDDCQTDDAGGKHPKHAVVGICHDFEPETMDKDSPLYVEIRDAFFQCFKEQPTVWSLPVAERI